ncbi:MAG: hypothetical protein KC621_28640 [Myxococcales bacterium]|nr:hypothetical protein [Myxococcales bacterium]
MSGLPPGLGRAFGVAVAELGLRTASWIFVEEVGEVGGEAALNELRDCYGRDWPVLDAVAAAWQEGRRRRPLDPAPLLDALGSADRIVCVGIETEALDLLVQATTTPVHVVRQSVFGLDWTRFAANYEGRVGLEDLDTFQRLAGPRSVLLTFTYGTDAGGDGANTHVLPAWVRVCGEDVRTQFRSLVGWEVLGLPFFVYPRWLVRVPTSSFSVLVHG